MKRSHLVKPTDGEVSEHHLSKCRHCGRTIAWDECFRAYQRSDDSDYLVGCRECMELVEAQWAMKALA